MRYMCSAVVMAACAGAASADFAYNTFGPDWGYETLAGSNVTGADTNAGYTDTADKFTSALSGSITDIWVAVAHFSGPNAFEINLRADAGGEPGSVIHSWTLIDAGFPFDGAQHDAIHVVVDDDVQLGAGVVYWLDLHAADPSAYMVWHFTRPPIFETIAQRFEPDGAWNVVDPGFTSAFAIAVVPGPGAGAVALLGAIAFGARRRR